MNEAASPKTENVSDKLKVFHSLNPESKLADSDNACLIKEPWGDESLAIRVSSEATELIAALNKVRLPPRFTALWHTETKDLEFIFSPVEEDNPLRSRSFDFSFNGTRFMCEYADASEALNLIANAARPEGPPTDTSHRNLVGLRSFLRLLRTRTEAANPLKVVLTSFWIRNVSLDEESAVSLAKHLNFYMSYFDRVSPTILIHEDPITESLIENPVRYPFGPFPLVVLGRQLDPHLLSVWESSLRAREPFRRFLYNYQIVEYAAFYYLREEIVQTVRRIIATPDMPSRMDEASRQILDAIVEDRTSDEAKQIAVIQQYVDPDLLWKEIVPKENFFSGPTDFEGGFSLPPLINKGWELNDFKGSWIPKLPDALRKVRNALVHARELRQSRCISPTARNQHLLRPWSALMSAIAMQIMIYEGPLGRP